MTFHGRITSGQIVLDEPVNLPDGTEVTIVVNGADSTSSRSDRVTLYDRMKPIIGIAKHLPPDASTKIDEVLYGRDDE